MAEELLSIVWCVDVDWGQRIAGGFSISLVRSKLGVASTQSIRESISTQQLPLTGDNVYSELQKDIIRPIHLSASMAQNTFLRDWLSDGEREPEKITRYLKEIKDKNNIVTAFLVSEISRKYYHAGGVLKTVGQLG